MSHTLQTCPYCKTPMINTGSPIWEDYCPNQSCTGARDEMVRQVRAGSKAKAKADKLRDAAPELLEALGEAFDFLGGVDGAVAIRERILAVLIKVEASE